MKDGKAKYQNPKLPVETRVNDLLRRMTLDEKVRQLYVYMPRSIIKEGTGQLSADIKKKMYVVSRVMHVDMKVIVSLPITDTENNVNQLMNTKTQSPI